MNGPQNRRLEALVSALCDGSLDGQQQAELEQLLRVSAEYRRFYLQYIDMHARLTVHPNLASGIPLQGEAGADLALEDAVVFEAARNLLDDHRAAEPRRSGRFAAAVLVVAVVILFGWMVFDQQPAAERYLVVRKVVGDVTVGQGGNTQPAEIGRRLHRGERLHTSGEDSRLALEFADGTRVVLGSDSHVEVPADRKDPQLRLLSGTMDVDAARQPRDRPLVFATDHARYTVLGTRFRLYRDAEASRLELDEGKVRVERQSGGKAVEVLAGFVAVATSEQRPLEVRRLSAARCMLRATLPRAGQAVAFSEDGRLLATSDWERGLKTWRAGETNPQQSHESRLGRSSGLAFAGERVVHVSSEKRAAAVTLWRPGASQARTIPLSEKNTRSRALSPDGLFMAESDDDGTRVSQIDSDTGQAHFLATLPDNGKAWCLSLSHAARFAAAGFWDGTIRVYDPAQTNGDLATVLFEQRLKHTPTSIALSHDGARLAVFTLKDGLLLIDLADGRRQTLWAAGAASVSCLKFMPDGTRLMVGLNDGTARVWSAEDGRPWLVIDTDHVPQDIAWSAAESLLATAGGDVRVWECELP